MGKDNKLLAQPTVPTETTCAGFNFDKRYVIIFFMTCLLLSFAVSTYLVLGALYFKPLEARADSSALASLSVSEDTLFTNLRAIKNRQIPVDRDEFMKNIASGHLAQFEADILTVFRKRSTGDINATLWTTPGSIIFTSSVITTIGWGNIAPKTNAGRMSCIVYAIFGIPMLFSFTAILSGILNMLALFIAHFVGMLATLKKDKAAQKLANASKNYASVTLMSGSDSRSLRHDVEAGNTIHMNTKRHRKINSRRYYSGLYQTQRYLEMYHNYEGQSLLAKPDNSAKSEPFVEGRVIRQSRALRNNEPPNTLRHGDGDKTRMRNSFFKKSIIARPELISPPQVKHRQDNVFPSSMYYGYGVNKYGVGDAESESERRRRIRAGSAAKKHSIEQLGVHSIYTKRRGEECADENNKTRRNSSRSRHGRNRAFIRHSKSAESDKGIYNRLGLDAAALDNDESDRQDFTPNTYDVIVGCLDSSPDDATAGRSKLSLDDVIQHYNPNRSLDDVCVGGPSHSLDDVNMVFPNRSQDDVVLDRTHSIPSHSLESIVSDRTHSIPSHSLEGIASHRTHSIPSHSLEGIASHRTHSIPSHSLESIASDRTHSIPSHSLEGIASNRTHYIASHSLEGIASDRRHSIPSHSLEGIASDRTHSIPSHSLEGIASDRTHSIPSHSLEGIASDRTHYIPSHSLEGIASNRTHSIPSHSLEGIASNRRHYIPSHSLEGIASDRRHSIPSHSLEGIASDRRHSIPSHSLEGIASNRTHSTPIHSLEGAASDRRHSIPSHSLEGIASDRTHSIPSHSLEGIASDRTYSIPSHSLEGIASNRTHYIASHSLEGIASNRTHSIPSHSLEGIASNRTHTTPTRPLNNVLSKRQGCRSSRPLDDGVVNCRTFRPSRSSDDVLDHQGFGSNHTLNSGYLNRQDFRPNSKTTRNDLNDGDLNDRDNIHLKREPDDVRFNHRPNYKFDDVPRGRSRRSVGIVHYPNHLTKNVHRNITFHESHAHRVRHNDDEVCIDRAHNKQPCIGNTTSDAGTKTGDAFDDFRLCECANTNDLSDYIYPDAFKDDASNVRLQQCVRKHSDAKATIENDATKDTISSTPLRFKSGKASVRSRKSKSKSNQYPHIVPQIFENEGYGRFELESINDNDIDIISADQDATKACEITTSRRRRKIDESHRLLTKLSRQDCSVVDENQNNQKKKSDDENESDIDSFDEEILSSEKVPFAVYFVVTSIYTVFGGMFFKDLQPEDGGFVDGLYFTFIMLTTIGFGDIVPTPERYIILLVYGALGLALANFVTNMMIDKIVDILELVTLSFEEKMGGCLPAEQASYDDDDR